VKLIFCLAQLPQQPVSLTVGAIIEGWQKLHLVEACLRTRARVDGVYITLYFRKYSFVEGASQHAVFVSCEKGRIACSFFIRFEPHGAVDGWLRCTEIKTEHSCERATKDAPGGKLKKRMDAFVSWRCSR
jgi:hypothetical protein